MSLKDFSPISKMKLTYLYAVVWTFFTILCCFLGTASAQEAPKGQLQAALRYQPVQKDVDIDTPTDEERERCEINLYDGRRGYIITNPQKITIRLLLDSNADSRVDQWSYFKNGVEVYRDIDSDSNGKAEQFRWLNNAGTRWGVDTDGDQKIDYWKTISAEEVSREIALALATNDAERFQRVVLSKEDLAELDLGEAFNAIVEKKIGAARTGFASAVAALALPAETKWFQLGTVLPNLVPAGERENKNDLFVYENAVATAGHGADTKVISLGTLIRVSDHNWRVIDLPKEYNDSQYTFTFVPPGAGIQSGGSPEQDNEVVALTKEIESISEEILRLPADQRPGKHNEVILRMLKIVKLAATEEDRNLWIMQMADTIMAAAQQNEFPKGSEQLQMLYTMIVEKNNDELSAHVRIRQIMTDYFMDIQSGSGGDPVEKHLKWIRNLETFIEKYEKTEAGIEAMSQLAYYREMADETLEDSIKWYSKIAEAVPGTPVAEKAKGAVRRLTAAGKAVPFKATDSTGKAFDIASMKGSFVLLYFWDSRTAQELATIKTVADRFASAGLKVVGVNLDVNAATMKAALGQTVWPHIHMPGGLDSPPAVYWGVQSTPYMILYGKDGTVVNPNVVSAGDLQQVMTKLTQ